RHVVARHHVLLGHIDRYHAQIHSHQLVHNWNEQDESRPFGAQQFSESKYHATFVLAQDADNGGQRHDKQNEKREQPREPPHEILCGLFHNSPLRFWFHFQGQPFDADDFHGLSGFDWV